LLFSCLTARTKLIPIKPTFSVNPVVVFVVLLPRFRTAVFLLGTSCYFRWHNLNNMIQAGTVKFLQQLAKNNNKPWFDEHRDAYQAAKEDFEQFVTEVLAGLCKIDRAFEGQKAKDCIFRIFRDVRFSKDKTPYKAHFGAYFGRGGKKDFSPGYYLHLEPGGKTFAGGGLWEPEAAPLKALRQEIDYNFDEFAGIINDKKFKKLFPKINGEQLKTLPQGYTADNPAIEYLKLKSFTVGHAITDEDMTGKKFGAKVVEAYAVMQPFISFLRRATDDAA